jgi:hypothetical protein
MSLAKFVAAVAVAMSVAGGARAEVYDFARFLSGGGGGVDPQKQRIARQAGTYMCLDIRESRVPPANRIILTLWSQVPQPKSRIKTFVVDTGRHTGLFAGMSLMVQSPGLNGKVAPGKAHAFLPGISPDYSVIWPQSEGITPGKTAVVAMTLANGRTFSDVLQALNEGFNPATAANGLRIAVTATHLLGGPPPGVGTISDDGGFLLTSVSSRCRAR